MRKCLFSVSNMVEDFAICKTCWILSKPSITTKDYFCKMEFSDLNYGFGTSSLGPIVSSDAEVQQQEPEHQPHHDDGQPEDPHRAAVRQVRPSQRQVRRHRAGEAGQ